MKLKNIVTNYRHHALVNIYGNVPLNITRSSGKILLFLNIFTFVLVVAQDPDILPDSFMGKI